MPRPRATPLPASSIGDALSTDSSFLNSLDPNIARPFQVGYVDSTHLVYIIGGIIMVLAFLLVLVMKELPLRTRSALDERLQEQADSDAALAADNADGSHETAITDAEMDAIVARGRAAGVGHHRRPCPGRLAAGRMPPTMAMSCLNGDAVRSTASSRDGDAPERGGRHRAEV